MGPAVLCSKPAGTSCDCPEEREARVGRGHCHCRQDCFQLWGEEPRPLPSPGQGSPSGHWGVAPQCSLITMGAKAILPSTQCFRMVSMIPAGKWMWRSQRKTMLCGSWGHVGRLANPPERGQEVRPLSRTICGSFPFE